MHRVKIGEEIFYAEDGTGLSEILIKNKKSVTHPCGGRGTCKKCTVVINGKETLSCQYKIHSDIEVILPEKENILSATGAEEDGIVTENLCLALDIGTTTLALSLVSLDEKKIIRTITRANPQRVFGADVMTRIDYCSKNSVKDLEKVLTDEINSMIEETGICEAEKMYVSGNTTMLHLFRGVDCSSMGVFPYSPAFLESKEDKTNRFKGVKETISLPAVHSFVGADIVAGLNLVGFSEKGKYNILLDLGTNAEIVLFDESKILCTSAAAGPCFEGANISCGMSATKGAVFSYKKGEIKTIDDLPPAGICATGLIDLIAEFIDDKTIDKTGFMECEEFQLSEKISVTQEDIRQFQLAKSAVFSAIICLMKKLNLNFGQIDKLYVSGGFSAQINMENAVKSGLIPKELKEKCVAINNSSLLGTVKFATEKNDLSCFIKKAEYVDLSSDKYFSDLFIENLSW